MLIRHWGCNMLGRQTRLFGSHGAEGKSGRLARDHSLHSGASVVVWSLVLGGTLAILAACSDSGGSRDDDKLAGTTDGGSGSGAGGDTPGGEQSYAIVVTAASTDLRTKGAGINECTDVVATVKSGEEPAADVEVSFSVVGSVAGKQAGATSPESATTNASGTASTVFCASSDENESFVKATAGASSANSEKIKIVSVPSYRFSWKPARERPFALKTRTLAGNAEKLAEHLAQGPVDTDSAKALQITLQGGGNDCTEVTFELTKDGQAVSGRTLQFATQEDYPVGVKLAPREAEGKTLTSKTSGKKFAYADVTSNIDGVFEVPLCSGPVPGNVVISATFEDSAGREHVVNSPIIVMSGGLTNYGFMSLTFDPANARVISADTFTNTQKTLPFIARLGTLGEGSVIKAHPLGVLAEVGKVVVSGNGVPSDSGEVKFTLEALNTRGRRPEPVDPSLPDLEFDDETGYSACEPLRFPSKSETSPAVPYHRLAKNWRSTLMYYIQGSEFAVSNTSSSRFDASKAFGVWDVNQNGTYDGNGNNASSIDKITFVPEGRTAEQFKASRDDWFFDLPSPFVDSNENGKFDPGEVLVGDSYAPPNGRFDDSTYVWKSLFIPLYLGATSYSLQHSAVSGTIADFSPSTELMNYHTWLINKFAGTPYATSLASSVLSETAIQDYIFGFGPDIETTLAERDVVRRTLFFHAHDKCGSPLPGGKKISTRYEVTKPAAFGSRAVTTHFFVQPYDGLRESTKRLLAKANGSSDTTLNQDVLEHPAAEAGFPVELDIRIRPCENYCSGDLHPSIASSPPVYCKEEKGKVWLDIEGDVSIAHPILINEFYETRDTFVNSTNKCGCAIRASLKDATCTCPSGTVLLGDTCLPPPTAEPATP